MYKSTIIIEVESDNLDSLKTITGELFKKLNTCDKKGVKSCFFEENIEKDRKYYDRDECEIKVGEV